MGGFKELAGIGSKQEVAEGKKWFSCGLRLSFFGRQCQGFCTQWDPVYAFMWTQLDVAVRGTW